MHKMNLYVMILYVQLYCATAKPEVTKLDAE